MSKSTLLVCNNCKKEADSTNQHTEELIGQFNSFQTIQLGIRYPNKYDTSIGELTLCGDCIDEIISKFIIPVRYIDFNLFDDETVKEVV